MFKVGDEVFMKAKVIQVDDEDQEYTCMVEYSPECRDWFRTRNLIPASRVTVAPARRSAEFPKDYEQLAWVSDDQITWHAKTLVGYIKDYNSPYITSDCGTWKFAEVEE